MKSSLSYLRPNMTKAHRVWVGSLVLAAVCATAPRAFSQAITIDTHGRATGAPVDRRYAQITPTHVQLPSGPLDTKTRLELIRLLQAEQGFAMRPFPKGHKGLTIEANGKLIPAGEPYLNMVTEQGISAKPGERLVITDLKFEKDKIILMLNGGPDAKHRFLRHIQIGAGGGMTSPVVQDDGQDPQGARLTLAFKGQVPPLTDKEVKALLSPLISFDLKTPIQAFTDTLPPALKDAILNHHVMVGMTTDMVMFAMGQPDRKVRETEGQTPFEEWIYGAPPKPVQFVRINGNRVIRLEIAAVGKSPQIFEKDEVEGLMRTDGSPLAPTDDHTRTVALGDVVRDPNTQAPAPPPTLHKEGDTPDPAVMNRRPDDAMKPVQFPQQKPDDYPDATGLPRTPAPADEDANKPADAQKPPANPPAQQQPSPQR
ncbi:hypothetical protein [Occallatibacter riparius]|uniref:Uncharacterized protein n=1 Tax=Occallatibacter riparius TaxID=1002689 RepID=A0A9J7BLC6_9BACT|nr:hypothetical protein [Occallatibacter riparius]UWZ82578.1 hypothetical protein MOP44_18640 [Occallatibacter riparius]